jgi:hypothetical protein
MLVYEVIQEALKKGKKAERVKVLKDNETWALKDCLRGMYDETVIWNLPPGEPPYQPNEGHNAPGNLLRENTKFKYLVPGGQGSKLPAVKREAIFIGMLETVHPEDAKLLINVINKTKIKGITRPMINEAFPGLLKDE